MSQFSCGRRRFLAGSAAVVAATAAGSWSWGQEASSKQLAEVAAKGIEFLQTKGQAADGTFTKQIGIGITALAATAMLRHGRSPDDPAVAKALAAVVASVQPTGGIHNASGRMKTYETCVSVVCLAEANRGGKYDEILKNADKFLKGVPFDAQEGHEQDSFFYGGAGYGGQGRPDLSNTAFLIDALKSTGNGADEQAIRNALIFVNRCQNLESPHNTTPFAGKINDGGFYYTPVPGDKEKEDEATGGLRSYGAMSYAGLKSMIFAGVSKDDQRVKAVVKWIGKNYDLKSHPGQGEAGLYYYYATFAKSLAALGDETITDAKGKTHNWRQELLAELASRQREDGSWSNKSPQFLEGDPNLATSFALLALADAVPPKKK